MFAKKKTKQDPSEFAKQCYVVHNGAHMSYDEQGRFFYLSPTSYTVFPSKHKALSAIHHAVETEKAKGRVEDWKEYYQVVET